MGTQVKLRGIRTELGEVANSILPTSDGILSNAVVRVRGDTKPDPCCLPTATLHIQTASLST